MEYFPLWFYPQQTSLTVKEENPASAKLLIGREFVRVLHFAEHDLSPREVFLLSATMSREYLMVSENRYLFAMGQI